jgi:hypothetical protein
MLDKDSRWLIMSTPALLATHEVGAFHGQSSPEMPHLRLRTSEIDEPLLAELLSRWRRRYAAKKPAWADVALFRSLNMAYQASQLPAGADTTLYDVGRLVALWVSAFEILAHPGMGKSGLFAVYDLLDKVGWQSRETRARRYNANEAGRRRTGRRAIARWLYGEIHRARNDFLHGNPVSERRLLIRRSGRQLFQYGAPLYRLALTGFLPLNWTRPAPSMQDTDAASKYIRDHMDFMEPQRMIERALRVTFVAPDDARAARQGRSRR